MEATKIIDYKKAIADAFKASTAMQHVFTPEIKVRRRNDTLYVLQLRKTMTSILAEIEVGVGGDKAPCPLDLLDDTTLKAIYNRFCK